MSCTPSPQLEKLVPYIPLLTIVVTGLRKPYTETEVGAHLELIDVIEDLKRRCFYKLSVYGIEIPGIYKQDQKYNNENTQTITEIMKQ
jgi:hypothetical protein